MRLNHYQDKTAHTAGYKKAIKGDNGQLAYVALGLTGEAGEVANILKKVMRDDHGLLSEEKRDKVKDELGDVLWYVAQLASQLDLSLQEVAEFNIDKLATRYASGKDNRRET